MRKRKKSNIFRCVLLLILALSLIVISLKDSVYSTTDIPGIPLESDPSGIAINPIIDIAIISNERSNSVSIVDLNTETVSTIPAGKFPRGVAIDTELNLVVIGNSLDNTVSIIDLNTLETTKINVGKSPEGLTINPRNHTVLVSNHKDSTVSIIDLTSYETIRTIEVGREPIDIAIYPNPELDSGAGLALVVNEKDYNISVIDLNTYAVINTVPVEKKPQAIDINPETGLAVVANEKDNSITVIDLATWDSRTIPVGKHPIDVVVNPLDNRALVLCDEDRSLLLIDLNTDVIIQSYDLNDLSKAVAVNPFTNIAGIVDHKTDSLRLIQLPNPIPELTSIIPETILRGSSAADIVITGSGFIKTSSVSILAPNPQTLTTVFIDNHNLGVEIPELILQSAGIYQITVTNPEPEGGTSNALELTVANPIPAITTIDPAETTAGTISLTVDIHGTGFFNDTTVYINNTPRSFTLISQTNLQIDLTATDLETGAYLEITASNPPPGGGLSAPTVFTVLNPIPALTSIEPASIIAGSPDLTLTVTGNNFVNTSTLTFNNTQYQTTYINSTRIQTTIPSSAIQTPGDYPVIVTNPAPGGGESSPVIFTVTSLEIPPPETEESGYIDGYVYDARTDSPLSGVSITVAGITGQISTDTQGFFAFPISDFPPGIPAKEVILTAEKTGYTYGQRRLVVRSKVDERVDDIYLVPRDTVTTTITPEGGIAVNSRGNIILEFPEGAVNAPIEVNITEYDSSKELPAPLPETSHFTFAADFQPDGAVFNQPVHLKVENFLGFPPGTPVPVGYYYKGNGVWIPDGMGVISNDGQWMEYDLTHFSTFDLNWPVVGSNAPPSGGGDEGGSSGGGGGCDGTTTCCGGSGSGGGSPGGGSGGGGGEKDTMASSIGIRNGSLDIDHKTPGYTVLGKDFKLILRYNSKLTNPQVFIGRTSDYSSSAVLPDVIKAEIDLMGVKKTAYFQPSGDELSFRALFETRDARGNELSTGVYPYNITLTNRYDALYYALTREFGGYPEGAILTVAIREPKYVSKTFTGKVFVRNEKDDSLGMGWGIDGVRRLIKAHDGSLAVIEGDAYEVFGESIITTIAGNGEGGYYIGDGGLATEAGLSNPRGVTVDTAGNIYIADTYHGRIRKVDRNGIITTVAGNGENGYSGDGGPATEARLTRPRGVAVDRAGNIYIVDSWNNRIRKVDTNGIITTVAGNGEGGYSGDGGPATEARLQPYGVAVDSAGNLFISDLSRYIIRKVSTNGIITTVAGRGGCAFSGDGGPAIEANFCSPFEIALDRTGNLYIADKDNRRIRKLGTNGIVTTVAGNGQLSYSGDGGPATEASLSWPWGVTVDSVGNIYIADSWHNNRIRKVDENGIITTVAGNGLRGYSGDGGPATEAMLFYPLGVAGDSVGNIYIVDSYNDRIRKVSLSHTGLGTVFKSLKNNGTTITVNPDATYTMRYKDGFTVEFSPEGLQTSVTDRNGNTTEYVYDPEEKLIQVADPAGGVTRLSYTNGYLSTITDPQARTTTLNIDASGDLISITDPDSSLTAYTYDGSHRIVSKTLPGSRNFSYTYDSHDMLSSLTLPDGSTKSYVHSMGLGLLNDITSTEQSPAAPVLTSTLYDEVIDELSNTTRYRTNRHGLAVEKIDALGRATLTDRDENSRPLITTSPDGSTIVKTYDIKGNLLTQTDALGNITTYTYESTFNQVASITDPKGNVTTMEYDTMGNLTKTTDPLGNETTMTYDARGLLTSVTDANGNTIQYQYDSRGNLIKTIDQLGNETTNTRDSAGNTISTTDAEGNITSYEYDAMNNLTKVTDASGGVTTYTYASGGCTGGCSVSSGTSLLSSITDASGNTTSFEYDARGRQTKVVNPDGTVITKGYDAKGNLITQIDENGKTTGYAYDAVQRLLMTIDPMGGSTAYSYDVIDNLGSVTDANSNSTAYEYDSVRRPHKTISPDTGTTTYTYDANGNLLTKTDANGITTTYTYDSLNHLLSTNFPDPTDNVSYTYDNCLNGRGRLCSMTDPSGTTSYEYDLRGQVVKETKEIDGVIYVTEYSYSSNGNLQDIIYPDGRVVTYSYTANRKDSVLTTKDSITKTIVSGIAYAPTSLPLAVTYGNGITTDMSYDVRNRLESLDIGVLKQLAYTRDNTGNITGITDALNPAKNKTYTYDALYRMTQADGLWGSLNYNYDPVGNRQTETTDTGLTNYSYSANRLISSTGEKTFNFSFDANGNTTTEDTKQYIYNQNQRLIQAVENGVTIGEYTFNGYGQRVKKVAAGQTMIFHYSLDGQLIAESTDTGEVTAEYAYLYGLPLAKIEGDNVYFYYNDHLATPMVMADEIGSVVWEGEYLPFGEPFSVTGSITNNLRFPGQYYDEETGLHYNYFRDYKPAIGRYLEADPIGLKGGMNLYGYVGNNPVNLVDPLGLLTWDEIKEYGKCVMECIKDSPQYKEYKRRKSECLNLFMSCMAASGGHPSLVAICKAIKKACDAGATIPLIPTVYKCFKKCNLPPPPCVKK